MSIPSARLASRGYFLYIETLVLFRDGISPQLHAEGRDFLRSQVAGRVSSCDKVRPNHPLNGLLVNADRGLIVGDLTGRESKPFKGDRTDVELIEVSC